MNDKIIKGLTESRRARREFMKGLGTTGLAAAGAVLAGGVGRLNAQTITDADIVNFALNLEYLEAEFYTVATTGLTIDQAGVQIFGTGNPGPTTGGQQVDLSNSPSMTQDIALQIAADERAHVDLLRDTLGDMGVIPIAKPAINLNALGVGFNNQMGFLTLARAFEDVGVTAYAGAAPLLTSKTILGYAAEILATEALHSGNIRLQVSLQSVPTSLLDGEDILPPPSGSNYFPVSVLGLVQTRTPGQVLNIVYGSANVTSGGFFPNGVNGTINMSSTAAPVPPIFALP